MAWITPKQNWLRTDYFNLEDWNRIVGNAQYLHELFGSPFTWRDCYLADTASMPYYDLVNNIENNLLDLLNSSGLGTVEFKATTWYARTSDQWTHNPSADDFNRWESLEYQLYLYGNSLNILRAGTFYAGTNRVTQMLARGR